MAFILIASLTFIVTFVRRIRVARRWVWRFLFCAFPTLFYRVYSVCIFCTCCHQLNQIRYWFYILCIFCHRINQIILMMSMTMMCLTTGPLARSLFYCVFAITLVVLVAWGSGIFVPTIVEFKCDVFAFFVFVSIGVRYKGGRLIEKNLRSNSLFFLQISKSVL